MQVLQPRTVFKHLGVIALKCNLQNRIPVSSLGAGEAGA